MSRQLCAVMGTVPGHKKIGLARCFGIPACVDRMRTGDSSSKYDDAGREVMPAAGFNGAAHAIEAPPTDTPVQTRQQTESSALDVKMLESWDRQGGRDHYLNQARGNAQQIMALAGDDAGALISVSMRSRNQSKLQFLTSYD